MEFREVVHGSADYREAVGLRNALLRRPLGLELLAAELAREAGHRHFILKTGRKVASCLVVVPHGEGVSQIRQMAVHPDYQRSGLGTRLMTGVEAILREEGRTQRIFLNARVPAVPFYEKLGYRSIGEAFRELGIPHLRMEKALAFGRSESKG